MKAGGALRHYSKALLGPLSSCLRDGGVCPVRFLRSPEVHPASGRLHYSHWLRHPALLLRPCLPQGEQGGLWVAVLLSASALTLAVSKNILTKTFAPVTIICLFHSTLRRNTQGTGVQDRLMWIMFPVLLLVFVPHI